MLNHFGSSSCSKTSKVLNMLLWRFPIENHSKLYITEKRQNKVNYLTWNFIRLKFVKKTSMPNLAESLGYIKFTSSRPVKSPDLLKPKMIEKT